MDIYEALLAYFGGNPVISLEQAASYWNYKPETLSAKIDSGAIRLPWFRMEESQKAAKQIYVMDLAKLIETRRAAAVEEFERLWS